MHRLELAGLVLTLATAACSGGGTIHGPGAIGGSGGTIADGGSGGSAGAGSNHGGAGATASTASTTSGSAGGGGGAGGALPACAPPLGESYTSVVTNGPPTPNAATQPDMNIKLRGWTSTNAPLELVDYDGPTDAKAPHFESLVDGVAMPPMLEADRVNEWDWDHQRPGGPIASSPVTMIGFETTPGVTLRFPHGGYEIAPGLEARVLYLDDDSIALKYTGEDNVVSGYTFHLFGVCLEPALVALYRSDDAAGRAQMPGLKPNQAIGRARGDKVFAVIRDTGTFMDPRARKDWW